MKKEKSFNTSTIKKKDLEKLLGIVVLSLIFYINPIIIKDSNAGWFSNPLEKCMDRVLKNSSANEIGAARICTGKWKSF